MTGGMGGDTTANIRCSNTPHSTWGKEVRAGLFLPCLSCSPAVYREKIELYTYLCLETSHRLHIIYCAVLNKPPRDCWDRLVLSLIETCVTRAVAASSSTLLVTVKCGLIRRRIHKRLPWDTTPLSFCVSWQCYLSFQCWVSNVCHEYRN